MSKYSAGMMSVPYLFVETQNTARLLVERLSPTDVKQRVLMDNLYQLHNQYRAERYLNAISHRLHSLPVGLVREIALGEVSQAKLLVIIAIMLTDLLFFEFMYEVFRPALNIGSPVLETKDLNLFFDQKAAQSEVVSGWNETTIRHLKSSYSKTLSDAGLLEGSSEPRHILRAYLSEQVIQQLKKAGLNNYLACVLGDAHV